MRVTSFAGSAYIVTMSVSMFTRWYTMKKKGQCYEGHLFCGECIRRHNFPTKQTELKPKPNMEAVKCMCQQRIWYILAV